VDRSTQLLQVFQQPVSGQLRRSLLPLLTYHHRCWPQQQLLLLLRS
jgi:hypothetical protein